MNQRRQARLRLDPQGTLRCVEPRKRNTARECQTPIARPRDGVLVVRCRNCDADHIFTYQGGQFVYNDDAAPVPFASAEAAL